MRLAWCRRALLDALRRWGIYVALGLAILSGGVAGGLEVAQALLAWMVLPLNYAVSVGWPEVLLAVVLQATVGAAVVWALLPLLLPKPWLHAERALPLSPAQLRWSDQRVVGWALLPLLALYAAGNAALWAARPAWLLAHPLASVWAWLAAVVLSAFGGLLLLQARRQYGAALGPGQKAATRRSATPRATHWLMALVLLPLWRGPARRCGAVLVFSTIALLLLVLALTLTQQAWPQSKAWWLAAWAGLSWVLATRAGVLVREELLPLWQHTGALPVAMARVRRSGPVLVALPLLPSAGWLAIQPDLGRAWVLTALLITACGAAALQGLGHMPKPENRAATWLFTLVLLVVLASQVWP
jgi:hypothetical protein